MLHCAESLLSREESARQWAWIVLLFPDVHLNAQFDVFWTFRVFFSTCKAVAMNMGREGGGDGGVRLSLTSCLF